MEKKTLGNMTIEDGVKLWSKLVLQIDIWEFQEGIRRVIIGRQILVITDNRLLLVFSLPALDSKSWDRPG